MKTALIDGDIYIFKACAAVEHIAEWNDDLYSWWANKSDAIEVFNFEFNNIMGGYDDYIIALTSPDGFRYSLFPDYKSNRKGKRRPILLQHLREWVLGEYRTYLRPMLEADDVLGILATSEAIIPGDKEIVSIDKDMKTIPNTWFHNTGSMEHTFTSGDDAIYNHMYQTLIGDTADGYPGCPGIGPVKAAKILEPSSGKTELEIFKEMVVPAYEKAGQTREEALTQARLAKILTAEWYNFSAHCPILWEPKSERCITVY